MTYASLPATRTPHRSMHRIVTVRSGMVLRGNKMEIILRQLSATPPSLQWLCVGRS